MFYYLPNQQPIDVEGAIDAMLDANPANRYFLDTKTGDVGCIGGTAESSRSKLASVLREPRQYRELPYIDRGEGSMVAGIH